MKKLLITFSTVLGVTLAGQVLAAAPACDLSQQYRAFQTATQDTSYSSEAIRREVGARINLLDATIGCAKNELQTLKDSMPEGKNSSADEVRDRVLGAIDDANRFYDLKRSGLQGQGIEGTKIVAQEIKNWRNANYNNLLGRVQNFLIWNDNQALFDKASNRLSQSQLAVTSLKIIDNEDAQKLFVDAKNSWSSASDLNNRAGDAISRGTSSDETIDLIKQSLSSLASAYQNFLSIGDRLNKIVSATESTSTSE